MKIITEDSKNKVEKIQGGAEKINETAKQGPLKIQDKASQPPKKK